MVTYIQDLKALFYLCLNDKLIQARSNYKNAPQALSDVEKEYYVLKDGENAYKIQQMNKYKKQADNVKKFIVEKHNDEMQSAFQSLAYYESQRTFIENINEIQLYGEKLFNIYSAMNFSSNEAKDQVEKDLKNNIVQIDNYGYLLRDQNAFKSIGGVENVPKIKEYIVKNNLPTDSNDPKDYFLRHNGSGQFEIRRKLDIAPVYDNNNNPMIYYAKDLFNIANQININVEKEAMKSALKAQEKMQANKRQQAETGFGVTGP